MSNVFALSFDVYKQPCFVYSLIDAAKAKDFLLSISLLFAGDTSGFVSSFYTSSLEGSSDQVRNFERSRWCGSWICMIFTAKAGNSRLVISTSICNCCLHHLFFWLSIAQIWIDSGDQVPWSDSDGVSIFSCRMRWAGVHVHEQSTVREAPKPRNQRRNRLKINVIAVWNCSIQILPFSKSSIHSASLDSYASKASSFTFRFTTKKQGLNSHKFARFYREDRLWMAGKWQVRCSDQLLRQSPGEKLQRPQPWPFSTEINTWRSCKDPSEIILTSCLLNNPYSCDWWWGAQLSDRHYAHTCVLLFTGGSWGACSTRLRLLEGLPQVHNQVVQLEHQVSGSRWIVDWISLSFTFKNCLPARIVIFRQQFSFTFP